MESLSLVSSNTLVLAYERAVSVQSESSPFVAHAMEPPPQI